MVEEIRYEPSSKEFTFSPTLHGKQTESVRPMRFSPKDKWAKYRRKGLESQRKEKGLLN